MNNNHQSTSRTKAGSTISINNEEQNNPNSPTTSTSSTLTYLLILDFEATCDERKTPNPQEIIEFPTLLYNIQTRQIEDVFHYYIRPDVHCELSEFCTTLTGITQEQIENGGIPLKDALRRHEIWLEEHNLLLSRSQQRENGIVAEECFDYNNNSPSCIYLTCGDWDLRTCLPNQLNHMNEKVPSHFKHWINIKKDFSEFYSRKARGMVRMLNLLGLELDGRHHSGIDDCYNIAKICTKMLENGWIPKSPSENL